MNPSISGEFFELCKALWYENQPNDHIVTQREVLAREFSSSRFLNSPHSEAV